MRITLISYATWTFSLVAFLAYQFSTPAHTKLLCKSSQLQAHQLIDFESVWFVYQNVLLFTTELVNFFTLHPNTQTFQRQLTSTKFDCIEFFTETFFFFAVAFGICRLSVKKCLVNTNPALYYHKSQYYQMHGVQSKRTANRSYKLTFFDKIVFSTVGKINFNHRNSIHINVNYSQTLISITLRLSSTHGNRYITLFN